MTQAEVDMYTGRDRYVYNRGAYNRSQRVRQFEQRARSYNRFYYDRNSAYQEDSCAPKNGQISEGSRNNTFYGDKSYSKSGYNTRGLYEQVDNFHNRKRVHSPNYSQLRCKRPRQDFKDYQRDSGGRFTDSYSQELSYNDEQYSQVPQDWSYEYCNEERNAYTTGVRDRFNWQRGVQKGRETTHHSEPHNDLENRKHKYSDRSNVWPRTVRFSGVTSGGSELSSARSREAIKRQTSSLAKECKSSNQPLNFSGKVSSMANSSSSVKTNINGKLRIDATNTLHIKTENSTDNDIAASSRVVKSACVPSGLQQKDGQIVTEHSSGPPKSPKESSNCGNDKSKDDSVKVEVPQSEQCDENTMSVNNSDLGILVTAHFVKSQISTSEVPKKLRVGEELPDKDQDLVKSQGNTSKDPKLLTPGDELPGKVQEQTSELSHNNSNKITDGKLNFGTSMETESPNHGGIDFHTNYSSQKTDVVSMTDCDESPEDIQTSTVSKPASMEIVVTGCEENLSSYTLHIVEAKECREQENFYVVNNLEDVVKTTEKEANSVEGDCEAFSAQQTRLLTKDGDYSLHMEEKTITLLDKAESVVAESESKSNSVHLAENCNGTASKEPPNEATVEKQRHFQPQNIAKFESVMSSKTSNSEIQKNASVLCASIVDNCKNLRKTSNVRNSNDGLVKKSITREVKNSSNLKEKFGHKVPEINPPTVPEKRKKYTILFEELFGKDDDDLEIFSKAGMTEAGQCGKKEKEPSSSFKTPVETKLKNSSRAEVGKNNSSLRVAKKIPPKENLSKGRTTRSASADVPSPVGDAAASRKGELPWVLKEIELEVVKDPRLSASKRRKSSNPKIYKIAKRLTRSVSAPIAEPVSAEKTAASSQNKVVKRHSERKVSERNSPKAKSSFSDDSKISDCNTTVEEIERESDESDEGRMVIVTDEDCNRVEEEELKVDDINESLKRKREAANLEENRRKLVCPKINVNVLAKTSSHIEGKNTVLDTDNSGDSREKGIHWKKRVAAQEESISVDKHLFDTDVCEKLNESICDSPVQTEVGTERLASDYTTTSEQTGVVNTSLEPNLNELLSDVNKCSEETPRDVSQHNKQATPGGNKSLDSYQDVETLATGSENGSKLPKESAPNRSNVFTFIDLTVSMESEHVILAPTETGGSVNTDVNENLLHAAPEATTNKEDTLNKPHGYIRVKDPKTLGIRSTTPEANQLQCFNEVKELMLQLFRAAPPDIVLKVRDFCELTMSVRNDLYHYMIQRHQIVTSSTMESYKASDLNFAWHCLYYCCEPKARNINKTLTILYGYFKSHIQTAILYALEMEGCRTMDAKQVFHFVKKVTKYRCCHSSKEACSPHVILRSVPRQSTYQAYIAMVQWKSEVFHLGGAINTSFLYPSNTVRDTSVADKSGQPVQTSYNGPLSRDPAVNVTVSQVAGLPDPRSSRTDNVNQYYGPEAVSQQNDKIKSNFEHTQRIYSGHLNNPVVGNPKSLPEQPYLHDMVSTNTVQNEVPNLPPASTNYSQLNTQHIRPPGIPQNNAVQTVAPNASLPTCGTQRNEHATHLQRLSEAVTRTTDTLQQTSATWLHHVDSTTHAYMNRPPPPYGYNNRTNSAKVPCSVTQPPTSNASSAEPRTTGSQHVIPRRYSSDSNPQTSANLPNSSEYGRWNGQLVSQSQQHHVGDVNSVAAGVQNHNYSQLPQHNATVLRQDVQNSFNRLVYSNAPVPPSHPLLRALVEGNRLSTRIFQQNGGVSQSGVQQNQLNINQGHWQTTTAYPSVIHQFRESRQPSNVEGKRPNCQNEPPGYRAAIHTQFTTPAQDQICSLTQSILPIPVTSFQPQNGGVGTRSGSLMARNFSTQAQYNVAPSAVVDGQPPSSQPQVSQHHPRSAVGEPRRGESLTSPTFVARSGAEKGSGASVRGVENQADGNALHHTRNSTREQLQVAEPPTSAYQDHQAQLHPNVSQSQPLAASAHQVHQGLIHPNVSQNQSVTTAYQVHQGQLHPNVSQSQAATSVYPVHQGQLHPNVSLSQAATSAYPVHERQLHTKVSQSQAATSAYQVHQGQLHPNVSQSQAVATSAYQVHQGQLHSNVSQSQPVATSAYQVHQAQLYPNVSQSQAATSAYQVHQREILQGLLHPNVSQSQPPGPSSYKVQQQAPHRVQLHPSVSPNRPTTTLHYQPTTVPIEQQSDKSPSENPANSVSHQAVQRKRTTQQSVVPTPTTGIQEGHPPVTKQDARSGPVASSWPRKLRITKARPPASLSEAGMHKTIIMSSGLAVAREANNPNPPPSVTKPCQATTSAGAVEQHATESAQADLRISEYWASFVHNEAAVSVAPSTEHGPQNSRSTQSVIQEGPQMVKSTGSECEMIAPLQTEKHHSEVVRLLQVSTAGPLIVSNPQLQITAVSLPVTTTNVTIAGTRETTQNKVPVPRLPQKFGRAYKPAPSARSQLPLKKAYNKVVQLAPILPDLTISQVDPGHACQNITATQPAVVQLQVTQPAASVVQGTVTSNGVNSYHLVPQLPNSTMQTSQVSRNSGLASITPINISQPLVGLSENFDGLSADNGPLPITVGHVSTSIAESQTSKFLAPSETVVDGKNVAEDLPPVLEKQVDTATGSLDTPSVLESNSFDEMPVLKCQELAKDLRAIVSREEERPTVPQKQVEAVADVPVNSSLLGEDVAVIIPVLECDEGEVQSQIVSLEEKGPTTVPEVTTKSNREKDRLQADVPLETDSTSEEIPCTRGHELSDCDLGPSVQLRPGSITEASSTSETVVSLAGAEKENLQCDRMQADSDRRVTCGDYSVVATSEKVPSLGRLSESKLKAENCSEIVTSSSANCQPALRDRELEGHEVTDSGRTTPADEIHNQEKCEPSNSVHTSPDSCRERQVTSPTEGGSKKSNCGLRPVTSISELKALIDSGEIVSISQLKSLLYCPTPPSDYGLTSPESAVLDKQPTDAVRDTVLKGPVNLKTGTGDQLEKNTSAISTKKEFSSEKPTVADVLDTSSNLQVDPRRTENLPSGVVNSEREHLDESSPPVSDDAFLGEPTDVDNGGLTEKSSPPEREVEIRSTGPVEDNVKFRERSPDLESDVSNDESDDTKPSLKPESQCTREGGLQVNGGGPDSESYFVDLTFQPLDDLEELETATPRRGSDVRLLDDDEIDEIVNNLERTDESGKCSEDPVSSGDDRGSPDYEALTGCPGGSSGGNTEAGSATGDDADVKESIASDIVNCIGETNSEDREESYEALTGCPRGSSGGNTKAENPTGEDADMKESTENDIVNCSPSGETNSEDVEQSYEESYPRSGSPAFSAISSGSECFQEVFITEEIDIKSEGSCDEDVKPHLRNCVCCYGNGDSDDDEVTILDQIIGGCDPDPDIEILEVFPKEVEVLRVIKREEPVLDGGVLKSERDDEAAGTDVPGDHHHDGLCKVEGEDAASDDVTDGGRRQGGQFKSCLPLLFSGNNKKLDQPSYAVYPENVKCAACSNFAVLLCSGCRITCYCSVLCQYKDWAQCHSKECDGPTS